MEHQDNPCRKISICIPSIGRHEDLKKTLDTFFSLFTYPNYEMLILESTGGKFSKECTAVIDSVKTKEYLDKLCLDNPNIIVFYKPWVIHAEVYKFFFENVSSDYLILFEDDITTYVDPAQHILDSIRLMEHHPNIVGVQQAIDLSVSFVSDLPPLGCGIKNKFNRFSRPIDVDINDKEKPPFVRYDRGVSGAAKAACGAALIMYRSQILRNNIANFMRSTRASRSGEVGLRGLLANLNLDVVALLNSWGWCGHTGLISSGKFSRKHLQNVQNFYNHAAECGLVGSRNVTDPWGTREENRKKVGWRLP